MFYTSGRTSNEAAFIYQLFARAYGTNNLPDCSNMCHESTRSPSPRSIGIGKGTSPRGRRDAELIVIVGQNPGTNHPRMLTALEKAKQNGARILAVNPLHEAGLLRFKNPQTPARRQRRRHRRWPTCTCRSGSTATWRCSRRSAPAARVGLRRPRLHRAAHRRLRRSGASTSRALDWAAVERATGLPGRRSSEAAEMFRDSDATVICWAMGITQHRNAVATIHEIVNVRSLHGNIGKPGAGLCPVRGHSNVQGDRTMGIWERPPAHFLDALHGEFGFDPPREHGFDTVDVDPRHARRAGEGVLRAGRQLRRRRTRHARHRGGDAQRRAHGAGLHQAEPLPRRARSGRR